MKGSRFPAISSHPLSVVNRLAELAADGQHSSGNNVYPHSERWFGGSCDDREDENGTIQPHHIFVSQAADAEFFSSFSLSRANAIVQVIPRKM